jgi:hypothetical protein
LVFFESIKDQAHLPVDGISLFVTKSLDLLLEVPLIVVLSELMVARKLFKRRNLGVLELIEIDQLTQGFSNWLFKRFEFIYPSLLNSSSIVLGLLPKHLKLFT